MIQRFHSWCISKKKKKNTNSKRQMHCNVHSSIIYNCQDMERTCVCQQMKDKEDVAQASR